MEPVNTGEASLVMVTDKAILVDCDAGRVWIPRSAVHDDSEIYGSGPMDEPGDLIVKRWFAVKQGWE